MERRLILVTNDDGYASRGMEAMIRLARRFGDVVVVAPEQTQSGMSQAFTMARPLFLREVRREEGLMLYALTGTPVDCVKMAFDFLLGEICPGRRVDLVLSGINHGSNAASGVLYSGTMGAAMEGSLYDCPAIGLSLTDPSPGADFTVAEHYGEQIVRRVLEGDVELPLCLNVNIPAVDAGHVRGVRVCRQTRGMWREAFVRREDPHGRAYFWLTGDFVNGEPDAEDTDEWALAHGYVAVTPVQIDLTDYERCGAMRALLEK